jgi:hypothetical protein
LYPNPNLVFSRHLSHSSSQSIHFFLIRTTICKQQETMKVVWSEYISSRMMIHDKGLSLFIQAPNCKIQQILLSLRTKLGCVIIHWKWGENLVTASVTSGIPQKYLPEAYCLFKEMIRSCSVLTHSATQPQKIGTFEKLLTWT